MDMRRSSFEVGRRRRVKRASGVISGVLALPSLVVVDPCGRYHHRRCGSSVVGHQYHGSGGQGEDGA